MAATKIIYSDSYTGTHEERIAMDITKIPIGSDFLEEDTGEAWYFGKAGWKLVAKGVITP